MLNGLIGRGTSASTLVEGLNASQARVRGIAARVANAITPGFDAAMTEATGQAGAEGAPAAVDLETEMVALADEQLRFEATTRLLQKVYAQVRTSVRER